jgi:uncharacterized protein YndB with AHSA1/START domain
MTPPSSQSRAAPAAAAQPPVSNEAAKKRTGRDWAEWCALLDKEGAEKLSHREIVRLIHEKYHGGDWWSQMITVGYERLRGRREVNQRIGGFAVSASKTIAAAAADAFAAWTDARRRARWLSGVKITVRTATAPKSIRLICDDDGTEIEVRIAAKGRARCAIAVDHTKLANAQMVAERRHCWKEMLGALKHYLESAA